MELKRLIIVAAIVACQGAPPVSDAEWRAVEQLVLGGDCADPRDFGAIVNDGIDDMAAIQSAIDSALATARPVCLPTGTLHITKRPGTGLANVASLTVSGDGLTIYGQGDYSRISLLGDAPGDWWAIKLTGTNHTLRNFSIDGADRGSTTEQTHLVQVWGPASGITLESMRLNLPDKGAHTGGDCIRAGGEEFAQVDGLVIDKVRGIACDRSFFGGQRWIFGIRILNSSSYLVGDQAVDFEVSGVGYAGDIIIRDCRFRRNGLGDAAALALATSAGGAPPGFDVLVERTTLDGSISVFSTGNVTLRNVRAVAQGDMATLDIRKASSHVVVDQSYLEHYGSTSAPVVFSTFHTSAWPRFVTITRSHLVQRTGNHVINAEPADGLAVDGNEIECLGPTPNTFAAVMARSTVAPVTGIGVVGNTVTGNCKQLARASATATYGIGVVKVRDNEAAAVTQGVFFENGTPSSKPTVDSNTFGAATTAVVGAGTAGFIGTNQ